MKLEVGKYYKNRNGAVRGPLTKNRGSKVYTFTADTCDSWMDNGSYEVGVNISDSDLIEEYETGETTYDEFVETLKQENEALKSQLKELTEPKLMWSEWINVYPDRTGGGFGSREYAKIGVKTPQYLYTIRIDTFKRANGTYYTLVETE